MADENRTAEDKLRKWLTVARPAWSYPLEKEEAVALIALIAEIDRLRAIEEAYEETCSAAEDRRFC